MLHFTKNYKISNILIALLILILAIVSFFIMARINYLLFHSVAEGFAIIVAVLIYILASRTFKYSGNNYLLFLGYVYFFIAIIDFFHLLTYKGMGVFPGNSSDIPTQLWIAGRYFNAFSLLLASFLIRRKISRPLVIWSYSLVTGILLVLILHFKVFPVCFIEGQGLTKFKIISEYIISLILLVTIAKTYFERERINQFLCKILITSMAVTILSELSFTLYTDVYGIMNFAGHIFKIISFYMVYRGVVQHGIDVPYDLIFKELSESEISLRAAHQKLANIIDFLPDATFVVDKDKKVIAWNKAIEEMTGLRKEDILGKGDYLYAIPFYGKKNFMLVDYVFLNDKEMHSKLENQYDIIERRGNKIFAEGFRPSIFQGKGAYVWFTASPLYDCEGSIDGAIESIRDITKHIQAEAQLEALSTIDGLTGVANRRYFDGYLEKEWTRSLRSGRPLSLIMCDIDFFKGYNDTYGHLEGDECLRKVAGALNKMIKRPGDLVARFGGEEFVVVLPETDLDGAVQVAELLRSKIEELKIEHKKSRINNYLTISLGVSTVVPDSESSSIELISLADTALYQAKKEGRNRISHVKKRNHQPA